MNENFKIKAIVMKFLIQHGRDFKKSIYFNKIILFCHQLSVLQELTGTLS